jgi:HEAT repeat protein
MKLGTVLGTIGCLAAFSLSVWIFYPRSEQIDNLPRPVSTKVVPPSEITAKHEPLAAVDVSHDSIEDKEGIFAAISSGDPRKWKRRLFDLKNIRYDRKEVIQFLAQFLASKDLDVRTTAAFLLFELGSDLGAQTLREVIRQEASGGKIPDEILVLAADTLRTYHQKIDLGVLYQAYQNDPSPGMLQGLVLEEAPEVRQIVADKIRGTSGSDADTALYAGMLRLNDKELVDTLTAMAERQDATGIDADWAIYRATGDPARLGKVIDAAKVAVGLIDGTRGNDSDSRHDSLVCLAVTVTPEVTQTLRDISNYTANTDANNFEESFGSLFYVHHDYGFVDSKVLDFLNGKFSGQGIDGELMWEIAAARGTPEIVAAAQANNPEAYQRYFVSLQGRPIESWIYQAISNSIPYQAQ